MLNLISKYKADSEYKPKFDNEVIKINDIY